MKLKEILHSESFYRNLTSKFEVGDYVVNVTGSHGKVLRKNIKDGYLILDSGGIISKVFCAENCKRIK